MNSMDQIIIIFYFLINFNLGISLRLIDIQLPSIAVFGKPAQLNCTYDLGKDQLYSIKWFHNNNEFYRYLPNDNPPAQSFNTKGLHVDLTKSSKSLVYLQKVDLRTDGLFRVEVSAEAPSFQTVRKEKYLNVYYFPRDPPIVKLLLKNATQDLNLNDILDVKCLAGPARPATKLQFFINDLAISPKFANLTEIINPIMLEEDFDENELISKSNLIDNEDDYNSNDLNQNNLVLFNTTLRLRIKLRQSLLKNKRTINLRCTSYVTHLFVKTSEHVFTILNDNNQLIEMSRSFQRKKSNSNKSNIFNKKTFGPYLEGAKSNYAIGDLVNVTCYTGNSYPPAYLQFFINDIEVPNNYLKFYKPIETKDGLKSLLGLNFKLTEEFLINQQQLNIQTTTINSIITQTEELTNFQELNLNQQINQTLSSNELNRGREFKIKCTAKLNRIINVKNARIKQFQLDEQSKLDAFVNCSFKSFKLFNIMQFCLLLFILIYNPIGFNKIYCY